VRPVLLAAKAADEALQRTRAIGVDDGIFVEKDDGTDASDRTCREIESGSGIDRFSAVMHRRRSESSDSGCCGGRYNHDIFMGVNGLGGQHSIDDHFRRMLHGPIVVRHHKHREFEAERDSSCYWS
jgi:hypothetical protein